MTDVNTVAEPSNATTATQYDGWDSKGTPIVTPKPETKKPEESSASAASAKETQSEPKGKIAAEPEAAHSQEKPKERKPGEKKSAEERIADLTSEIKRLSGELERSRSERATEPAKKTTEEAKPNAQPATYAEWRKTFKPKEWIEQYAKDNPNASYEEAVAAMGDHQADIRDKYSQIDQLREAGVKRGQEQLRKAIETYPDAEPKVKETAKRLQQADIPPFVTAMINDSDVMGHLLYTLADPKTLENLLETAKSQPGKAVRAIRDMELEIEKAIAKPADRKEEKKAEAKAEEKTPVETKPRAPKPPVEVGGRGTGEADATVAAARANDFSAFEAEQNRRMQARFAK